ncbi:MAG TPA: sugar phosphate isomerase/epimerase [Verrucomicrobiae bacterium]|nr:sugar phosphate isomerase/epimerase [Verrucomicrobiae bacterium]
MQISLSTGTLFTLPLRDVLRIAATVGFAGVELIVNQDFQRVSPRRLLGELVEIAPVLSLHAPFMPLDGWGSPVDSLRRCVELAAEFGVPLVNFHPPCWTAMELSFWRWMYRIIDFQKEVGGEKVTVTVENMPWVGKFKLNPHILSQTDRMIEFIRERNLFMTFDCTHMGSGKANFINEFYQFHETGRIRNIHFSDYGNGREHLLPGHGILPLTRFLKHLRQTGYDGTFTLELSPHELPRDEKMIMEVLGEILVYLRRELEPQPTP